ncbi:MAG TPA: hypothetical protein VIU45_09075, partial [Chitinophagaceae bacterium]
MYTKENERRLAQEAQSLLEQLQQRHSPPDPEKVVGSLRKVINYNDWRYYVQSDPLLSDYEYDQLFAWL